MVFSTTWLEFKDMAHDPLVRREPVSASCNQWPDEGLSSIYTGLVASGWLSKWGQQLVARRL
jgi:hypothetical protein